MFVSFSALNFGPEVGEAKRQELLKKYYASWPERIHRLPQMVSQGGRMDVDRDANWLGQDKHH